MPRLAPGWACVGRAAAQWLKPSHLLWLSLAHGKRKDPCLPKGTFLSFSVPLSLSSSPSPRTFLQLFRPSPSPSPAPNHKGARQVSFCSDKEDILPGNKTPGSPLAGTLTFRAPSTSSLPLSSPILESERENSPTTNHDLLISQGLKRGFLPLSGPPTPPGEVLEGYIHCATFRKPRGDISGLNRLQQRLRF